MFSEKKMCVRSHTLNKCLLVGIEYLIALQCSYSLDWVIFYQTPNPIWYSPPALSPASVRSNRNGPDTIPARVEVICTHLQCRHFFVLISACLVNALFSYHISFSGANSDGKLITEIFSFVNLFLIDVSGILSLL